MPDLILAIPRSRELSLAGSDRLAEGEFRRNETGRSQRFKIGELFPLVITLKAVGTMRQGIEETETEPQMTASKAPGASTPRN